MALADVVLVVVPVVDVVARLRPQTVKREMIGVETPRGLAFAFRFPGAGFAEARLPA